MDGFPHPTHGLLDTIDLHDDRGTRGRRGRTADARHGRPKGSVPLAVATVLAALILTLSRQSAYATVGSRGPDPAIAPSAIAVATFTSPAAAGYARTGDQLLVAWTEANADTIVARTVTQETGSIDAAGGCARTAFAAGVPAGQAGTSLLVTGLRAGTCYRWTVRLSVTDGTVHATTSPAIRVLTAWTGSADTYRAGAFSSQARITWCTAASTQMMLNITRHRARHGAADQHAIWAYEQAHDRYPTGVAHGSDPQGWAAALRHYGASPDYRWHSATSVADAVKQAARRVRVTGKPAGLLVMNGNHAWVMTGFTATADPAVTSDYTVTAVFVLGPLYPRTPRHGYDRPPHTRLAMPALAGYLQPYRDGLGPRWSIWEHTIVTITP